MRVTLITDNDVVLWKVCCNSQFQGVLNFHAKIVTSCYTIQNAEWSDALDDKWWATNEYIPLLIRQMNDAKENLYPNIFDVPDSTVIFCKLQYAWNGHSPLQNVMF